VPRRRAIQRWRVQLKKTRVYQSSELPGSIQDDLLRFRQSGLKQWVRLFDLFLMVLVLPKTDESRSASISLVTNRQPRRRGTPTQKATEKKVLRKNSSGWSLKEASPPGRVQHLCFFSNQTLSIAFAPAFACLRVSHVTLAEIRFLEGPQVAGGDPFCCQPDSWAKINPRL
jgi:hypothetical protein